MVNQSSPRRILLTLSHGVVVPALSRRTGAPCRAVQTRWLLVDIGDQVRLVGCLDRKGRVFRTAVRDNLRLQTRSIANARELTTGDAIVRALDETSTPNFDMEATGTLFDFRTLRLADGMDNYSAWPMAGGDVVARLATTHGMLVPAVDPLKPPFRAVGVMWENGDFARNSSSAILSFVNSAGIIFAAAYPDVLAARFVRRNAAVWGEWLPEAPDEKAQRSATRMPSAAASSSISPSKAGLTCATPKPRKAPATGLLVYTQRPSTRTWGMRYGPPACSMESSMTSPPRWA